MVAVRFSAWVGVSNSFGGARGEPSRLHALNARHTRTALLVTSYLGLLSLVIIPYPFYLQFATVLFPDLERETFEQFNYRSAPADLPQKGAKLF